MSTNGIAGTPPSLPRAPKLRDPATPPVSLEPDFYRTLQDRAALTDPTSTLANGLGASTDAAPLAVSFDRGHLFGRAVELPHQHETLGFSETAVHRNSVKAVETASDIAEVHRAEPSPALQGDLEPACAGTASKLSDVGSPEFVSASGRPTVGNFPTAIHQPEGYASVEGVANSPGPPVLPSVRLGSSKASAWADAQSDPGTVGRPGTDLRQAAVELLTPVNVTVRSTQAGVQVTARIGRLSIGEDPSLESVMAEAAEDEDARLTDLRVNGREIRRSRECQ
jgi:hypothetical protein